jgi:hypothetical protein
MEIVVRGKEAPPWLLLLPANLVTGMACCSSCVGLQVVAGQGQGSVVGGRVAIENCQSYKVGVESISI